MIHALLYTQIIEKHTRGIPAEGGQFTVKVAVDPQKIARSGDPRRYFFKEIAIHLAQAILDTGVPKEAWNVEFDKTAQREFNLPERASFNVLSVRSPGAGPSF